jgi:predicted permease
MFISSGNFVLSLNYFAFGYDGFLRGVFFQMVNTSLMFTLGVYLVGRETNIRKIFQIPFFYAATAGVLIWVWHIKLPDFILHGVDFTGKAALPMLLLLLGYSLKNIQIENASLAITGGLFRIFGGLFIATFFVLVLRSTGLVGNGEQEILTLKLLIFSGSMPAAVGTLLLAQKYDRRPELVASSVFASTVIGLTTIPAVLWSVNYFFG